MVWISAPSGEVETDTLQHCSRQHNAKSSWHAEQFVWEAATYRSQYLESRVENQKVLLNFFVLDKKIK